MINSGARRNGGCQPLYQSRSVAQRLVCQTTQNRVPNLTVATTLPAPVIRRVWSALQDCVGRGDVLADTEQIEGVESAEYREVRGREYRPGYVEVFREDWVRTSIIGRPRPLLV